MVNRGRGFICDVCVAGLRGRLRATVEGAVVALLMHRGRRRARVRIASTWHPLTIVGGCRKTRKRKPQALRGCEAIGRVDEGEGRSGESWRRREVVLRSRRREVGVVGGTLVELVDGEVLRTAQRVVVLSTEVHDLASADRRALVPHFARRGQTT